jgi:hypothetical protein
MAAREGGASLNGAIILGREEDTDKQRQRVSLAAAEPA